MKGVNYCTDEMGKMKDRGNADTGECMMGTGSGREERERGTEKNEKKFRLQTSTYKNNNPNSLNAVF